MQFSWREWFRKIKSKAKPKNQSDKDIAIIGIACRFPGANDYKQFWENLLHEVNSVREITPDRWDVNKYYSPDRNQPNKSISKWGGLLDKIDHFDAPFFQLSPREATVMDPQQRLLLEETWHCIEDAGISLHELQQHKTSVYVGVMAIDYQHHMFDLGHTTDSYECLGNYAGILSNRLSYFFNFTGESQSIDAACASSLVSLHNARRSLLLGESEYAIAAGVSLICHPWRYISFSKSHMLSPDGQCKTFDVAANGYVPGEGVGVLLLCPLEKAINKGYHIYGVIKGSAVKHTGKAKSITAPRVEIERQVIEDAMKNSLLSLENMTYVEAHGTGTSLGDPIEVEALTQAFNTKKNQYCYIGTVKSNIGHLEAAAGVAGVIKVLLMMQHRKIPKTLNVKHVNPIIDFDHSPFRLSNALIDWQLPENIKTRFAGINSFGFGGVNAHVVLEEYIPDAKSKKLPNTKEDGLPFILSAKTKESLNALIEKWQSYIKTDEFKSQTLEEICYTLMIGREKFSYRFGVIVKNKAALVEALRVVDFARLEDTKASFSKKTVILRPLPVSKLVYSEFQIRCQQYSILSRLEKECETQVLKLKKIRKTPSILKDFIALYVLSKASMMSGLHPSFITGEGIGKLVGVVLAGIINFDDAIHILLGMEKTIRLKRPNIPFYDAHNKNILERYHVTQAYCEELTNQLTINPAVKAQLLQKARQLIAHQFTFKKYLSEWKKIFEQTGIIIENALQQPEKLSEHQQLLFFIAIFVSLKQLNQKWDLAEKIVVNNMQLEELVDLLLDDVMTKTHIAELLLSPQKETLQKIAFHIQNNQRHLHAKKTYHYLKQLNQELTEISDVNAWLKTLLLTDLPRVDNQLDVQNPWYVDIGDHSGLEAGVASALPTFLLDLWHQGVAVKWKCWYREAYQATALPLYPFAKERYWLAEGEIMSELSIGLHPLLDANTSTLETQCFTKLLTGKEFYLTDHQVNDDLVLPGVAYLEMARAAGQLASPNRVSSLRNIIWTQPIRVADEKQKVTIYLYSEAAGISFRVMTLKEGVQTDSIVHTHGKIIYTLPAPSRRLDMQVIKNRCAEKRSAEEIYAQFHLKGLHYGAAFQVIQTFSSRLGEALAQIKIPKFLENTHDQFVLHPSLLDGALQTALLLLKDKKKLYLPFSIGQLDIIESLPKNCLVHATLAPESEALDLPKFKIDLIDQNGNVFVHIKDFIARPVEAKQSDVYYFHPVWEKQLIMESNGNTANSPLLVFDDQGDVVQRLREKRPSRKIIQVKSGFRYEKLNEDTWQINPDFPEEYAYLFSDFNFKEIIYWMNGLPSIEFTDTEIQTQLKQTYYPLLYLTQALIKLDLKDIRLHCASAVIENHFSLFTQAMVGFAKTVNLEHPQILCRVIAVQTMDDLLHELSNDEVEVYYNAQHVRYIKRYQENVPVEEEKLPLRTKGVYLITGGAGGLGLIFANYLAKHYQAKLILTGRSELNESQLSLIKKLKKLHAEVSYIQTDMSNQDEIARLIKGIKERFGVINGIIHSAGVICDGLIAKKKAEESAEVFKPKIAGTIYLDEATRGEPLDFFVMFSSMVSIFGNTGQCDYAYANRFMDQHANWRDQLRKQNQRYGKTISINWPLWAEGGMRIDKASEQLMEKTLGVKKLTTEDGINSFTKVLMQNETQQIILTGDKQKILKRLGLSPELKKPSPPSLTLLPPLPTTPSSEFSFLLTKIQETVVAMVATILAAKVSDIDVDEDLSKYGMDSINLTELIIELDDYYGLELTPAILFEHKTLKSFAIYLLENHCKAMESRYGKLTIDINETEEISAQAEETSSVISPPVLQQRLLPLPPLRSVTQREDIAIIGINGVFPFSPNLDIFWENLLQQKDLIREVPKTRWNWEAYYGDDDNKTKAKWGGFIDDMDKFDAEFFNITPREAELMDPQQRIFLEAAWNVIEDAGYSVEELSSVKTGVFVGVATNDYAELIYQANENSAHVPTGVFFSLLSNRVSYFLNFNGPSETIDTACSSSLVAIHQALKAIQNGDCELALAGGVNALLSPRTYVQFTQAGMLCADGRCKTFDKAANGYVRGEGVGAVLLKLLDKAIADGDTIYGVIKGSAVNHGGRVSSLTVPNPNAQAEVIMTACERAHLDVDTISYIETHGTGTSLGDPIEVNGLKKAFQMLSDKQDKTTLPTAYCGLGTVKTNIGHLEGAAGIAGIIKVLLAMHYEKLPGIVHFKELNPYIEIKNSPFYILENTRDWVRLKDSSGSEIPYRAGISSFGFGGANAHIVIEEAPKIDTEQISPIKHAYLITLSAKTECALRQRMIDLEAWLAKRFKAQEKISIEDVSYTLNKGRSHLDKRCILIVNSIEELYQTIQQANKCERPNNFLLGSVTPKTDREPLFDELLSKIFDEICHQSLTADQYRKKLLALGNLYIKGYTIDWDVLHQNETKKRISLPPYPFAKDRHWITTKNKMIITEPPREKADKNSDVYYYHPIWKQSPGKTNLAEVNSLHIFDEDSDLVNGLRKELSKVAIHHVKKIEEDVRYQYIIYRVKTIHANGLDEQIKYHYTALLQLVQDLLKQKYKHPIQLLLIIENSESQSSLLEGALSGFAKALQREQPNLICRLLTLPPLSTKSVAYLAYELGTQDSEIRYESAMRFIKSYAEIDSFSRQPLPLKKGGVYLITGGAGGLGFLFAQYLAENFQAKLILTGRSELTEKIQTKIDQLQKLGAEVIYVQADVTQQADNARVLNETKNRFNTLNGIIHSAGIVKDAMLQNKTGEDSEAVLAPKVSGTLYLDAATQAEPLDFFILFSSVTSVLGNVGQCDYACANGFMDGFAVWRDKLRQKGQRQGKTIAINWPLWAEGGMRIDAAAAEWIQQTWGAVPLSTQEGIRAFVNALSQDNTQQIVLAGQKQKLMQAFDLITVAKDQPTVTAEEDDELVNKVAQKAMNIVSTLLKVPVQNIKANEALSEYGMDSVNFTAFTNQINRYYNLTLTPAILFEHKSLISFARYLATTYRQVVETHHLPSSRGLISQTPVQELRAIPTSQLVMQPNAETTDIAIIGMSGLFPGSADLEIFWDNLIQQKELISEVPNTRWNYWRSRYRELVENNMMVKWGGFIEDIEDFDAAFFNISPREAELMDPQHRLFLEAVWKTIEDAGYTPAQLAAMTTGLFAGVGTNDYATLLENAHETSAHVTTGINYSLLSNRVSYSLNLSGPSQSIDTACSSSLTALHNAVNAIRNGDCDVAIAGGVGALLSPTTIIELSKAGMLSPDGRCKTFDKDANGYVRGEGVGVVLLKPLAKALADGDHIYGVIKGTAINHGGHVSSLTVPNPNAQAEVIMTAMERAKVGIDSISYIETHGTGTALGDPIEVNGLKKAFHLLQAKQDKQTTAYYCGLGSVKTNIGHLEAAAGVAGVIKVLLAMQHGLLPGNMHFKEINPYIDIKNSPFYLVDQTQEWKRLKDDDGNEIPRRAGVSSFGFGGSNAHVVIEEPPSLTSKESKIKPYYLITLSAKTEESLKRRVKDLETWLAKKSQAALLDAITIESVSYTLNAGRSHFDKRYALIAASLTELQTLLQQINNNQVSISICTNLGKQNALPNSMIYKKMFNQVMEEITQASISPSEYHDALLILANLYVEGYDLDWNRIHQGESKQKISLPTYPFLKKRYWIADATSPDQARHDQLGRKYDQGPRNYTILEKTWQLKTVKNILNTQITGSVLVLVNDNTLPIAKKIFTSKLSLKPLFIHGAEITENSLANVSDLIGIMDFSDLEELNPQRNVWPKLELIQAILKQNINQPFYWLHFTRGLKGFESKFKNLTGAEMASLIPVLSAEYRKLIAVTIDIDSLEHLQQIVLNELNTDLISSEICYRDDKKYIPHFQTILSPSETLVENLSIHPEKVYVITGGTRGIGMELARYLVSRGARRLVLMGMQPIPSRDKWNEIQAGKDAILKQKLEDILALEKQGAHVEWFIGRLLNQPALTEFFTRIRSQLGTLGGVIHCAGLVIDRHPAFINKTIQEIQTVCEPKIAGLWVLHEIFKQDPLDFFILFSSISAQVPALGVGLSDYAMANGFMDHFASYQQRAGYTYYRSIAWPSWKESGMGEVNSQIYQQLGLLSLKNSEGLSLLEKAMSFNNKNALIVCVTDSSVFKPESLLINLNRPTASVSTSPPAEKPLTWLTQLFSQELKLPLEELNPNTPFGDFGVDSILLAELVKKIEETFAIDLDPSSLIEHPTLNSLNDYLLKTHPQLTQNQFVPPVLPTQEEKKQSVHKQLPTAKKIAVIGMACHFPGAPDLLSFWNNLQEGKWSVSEVPASRWDINQFYHPVYQSGKSISKWGGFLDDIEYFDAAYFGIAAEDAPQVDPLERQFLEASAQVLCDAGYEKNELWNKKVGVFVGSRVSNYADRIQHIRKNTIVGMGQNFIAAHVSHLFNFTGPSLVIDSACSSSLVSLHMACQSLQTGECELALAGGVDILLDERPYLVLSEGKALSPDGKCHTFDEKANGFVPGEGCGVVLLKPLEQAIADKDHIYAVIEATAVNNDGHTMGITTPNPKLQQVVIEEALHKAQLDPGKISYMETHGTGTMIGDPIELRALSAVFAKQDGKKQFCAVGSVKTNIGHLASAAGIASFIKVVLSIYHKKLVPTLFCTKPNPRFDFANSPFYPNTQLRDWEAIEGVRLAGMSSFGFGGTNAHCIVSEFKQTETSGVRNSLPLIIFNRQRYWLEKETQRVMRTPKNDPVIETLESFLIKRASS